MFFVRSEFCTLQYLSKVQTARGIHCKQQSKRRINWVYPFYGCVYQPMEHLSFGAILKTRRPRCFDFFKKKQTSPFQFWTWSNSAIYSCGAVETFKLETATPSLRATANTSTLFLTESRRPVSRWITKERKWKGKWIICGNTIHSENISLAKQKMHWYFSKTALLASRPRANQICETFSEFVILWRIRQGNFSYEMLRERPGNPILKENSCKIGKKAPRNDESPENMCKNSDFIRVGENSRRVRTSREKGIPMHAILQGIVKSYR